MGGAPLLNKPLILISDGGKENVGKENVVVTNPRKNQIKTSVKNSNLKNYNIYLFIVFFQQKPSRLNSKKYVYPLFYPVSLLFFTKASYVPF